MIGDAYVFLHSLGWFSEGNSMRERRSGLHSPFVSAQRCRRRACGVCAHSAEGGTDLGREGARVDRSAGVGTQDRAELERADGAGVGAEGIEAVGVLVDGVAA